MSKYKLDLDQISEAEAVLQQIESDADLIAFELVWRRHRMDVIANLVKKN